VTGYLQLRTKATEILTDWCEAQYYDLYSKTERKVNTMEQGKQHLKLNLALWA
jgi:hypothetical protein